MKSILLAIAGLSLLLSPIVSAGRQYYFPYLYQRTMYTDDLTMPGAWWANPAVISGIHDPFVHTANVLPLGDSLLISSFRLFFPVKNLFTIGAGILGAGGYRTGSSVSSVSGDGLSHTSNFAFKRPRFQFGAAVSAGYAGSVGVIGTIGGEQRSTGSYTESTASPGFGFGWLSPSIAEKLALSVATMLIHHDLDRSFWEKGAKLGFILNMLDSVITASAEYSITFGRGFGVFTPDESEYEIIKADLSARLYGQLAVSTGFSTDLDYPYNNGSCAHLGLNLKNTPEFPFCGGYDIGFRLGQDWVVIHHIWLGLNFRTLIDINRKPG